MRDVGFSDNPNEVKKHERTRAISVVVKDQYPILILLEHEADDWEFDRCYVFLKGKKRDFLMGSGLVGEGSLLMAGD